MVLLPGDPATTDISPELLRAKSNKLVLPNHALATALELNFFLNAAALSRVSLERVMGDEYWVDDSVGVEPSVV